MSILIKGMEMPVTCCHCPLMGYDPDREWFESMARTGAHICVLTGKLIDNTKREDHCPLVPVPPHGKCIDADLLCKVLQKNSEDEWNRKTAPFSWAYAYDCVKDTVENMPTILEAEEGE